MTKRVLRINADSQAGHQTLPPIFETICRNPAEGLKLLAHETFDAVLIEIEGPIVGSRAQDLLEQIQRLAPQTPVAIRDSEMAVSDALRLARFGAYPVIDPGDDLATLLSEAIT
ncbi:MAG: hypothetical protein JO099_08535, partial [Acidobacteriia bacterium]|nr:hypothetical protein [Terriglobia bacterium]